MVKTFIKFLLISCQKIKINRFFHLSHLKDNIREIKKKSVVNSVSAAVLYSFKTIATLVKALLN